MAPDTTAKRTQPEVVSLTPRTAFRTAIVSDDAHIFIIASTPTQHFRWASLCTGLGALVAAGAAVSMKLPPPRNAARSSNTAPLPVTVGWYRRTRSPPCHWPRTDQRCVSCPAWAASRGRCGAPRLSAQRLSLLKLHPCRYTESVLAVRGMGVQLQSKSAGGRQVTRFIDREHLRAAVVNEGYTCFSVRFYLAFLTAGSDELAVAFAGHTPRLPVVHATYCGVQSVLFGQPPGPALTQARYDAAVSVGRSQLQAYRKGLVAPEDDDEATAFDRVPYSVLLWREGVVSPYGGGDSTSGARHHTGGPMSPAASTMLDEWAAQDHGPHFGWHSPASRLAQPPLPVRGDSNGSGGSGGESSVPR